MRVTDQYGRYFRKLRVSLLDACNYRCLYCMPENQKFSCQNDHLSSFEIARIVEGLQEFGIEEVRLTGGEPTLRKDFLDVVQKLSTLGLKRLGMTTNAHYLFSLLPSLREQTSLRSINISLDSLNQKKFKMITKNDGLEKVLSAIVFAKELGFKLKINTVLMKGINDDEIFDFVEFARKFDIDIRFLEVMKIGVMKNSFEKHFISASEIIKEIRSSYEMKVVDVDFDSTSFNYLLDNKVRLGFIASESKPFCNSCSRLRLGPKGEVRSCLMLPEGVNFRNIKREDYPKVLTSLLKMKPIERVESQSDYMYQIGG